MNFGEALEALKSGHKVTRSVWGGYWHLLKNAKLENDESIHRLDIIVAVLRDGKGSAPASPYQEDLLSEDWHIVE